MSNDWNFDTNAGGSGKVGFTTFPVGITRIRVIGEAPYVRWTHWLQQHRRSINCPGRSCPICEIRRQQKANKEPYTYAMGRRFAINIFNLETNKVEIMEQGVGFFEDLKDLKDDAEKDSNTLQNCIIKVKRRGTGKDDTSYRLDIDEITPLTEVEMNKLKEQCTDLPEYLKEHEPKKILRVISGEAWDSVMMSKDDEEKEEDEEQIELK